MKDIIYRQEAIDIERNATVDTNPSHFEAHQKFMQFMDDAEISSFGRWQWSNGFNTALTAVGIDLEKLPPAQPEIIRCKDCIHKPTGTGEDHDLEFPDYECPCQCEDYWYSWKPDDNWYCGNGKRKEKENE